MEPSLALWTVLSILSVLFYLEFSVWQGYYYISMEFGKGKGD